MLDEAAEALRGARAREEARRRREVRLDLDVDAYVPADYVPFEAAKIDVHRRIAAAREPGELRALRDELRDRFGPLPEPVENLLALQRARIELGRAGARARRGPRRARSRSRRSSSTPSRSGAIRERIPEAIYESRESTLSLRVAGRRAGGSRWRRG